MSSQISGNTHLSSTGANTSGVYWATDDGPHGNTPGRLVVMPIEQASHWQPGVATFSGYVTFTPDGYVEGGASDLEREQANYFRLQWWDDLRRASFEDFDALASNMWQGVVRHASHQCCATGKAMTVSALSDRPQISEDGKFQVQLRYALNQEDQYSGDDAPICEEITLRTIPLKLVPIAISITETIPAGLLSRHASDKVNTTRTDELRVFVNWDMVRNDGTSGHVIDEEEEMMLESSA